MDPAYILEIRAFNRWYTSLIGLLDRYYLNSGYSLTEVRVLYEIHHAGGGITAHALTALLGLDKGYLSRILRQFEKDKLLDKKRSGTDKRSFHLRLSKKGAAEFGKLNRASQEQLVRQFRPLADEEMRRLVGHMKEIREIGNRGWGIEDIVIRTELRPGDIGYVTYLHGQLYKKEYEYGIAFEAYVAQGFYEFYSQYDPGKDRVWVAEHGDRIIGFLLLMHRGEDVAQLRYFILAPAYRGIGLGKKLAALFLAFAREQGYRRCYLWTTDELFAAAHIYRKMGFVLAEEIGSTSFGKPLKEQRYELALPL